MATLVALTGFEYGIVDSTLDNGTAPNKPFDTVSGSPAISSTTPNTGTYCLQTPLTAANWVSWNVGKIGSSKTVTVFSFYVYISTDPSANTVCWQYNGAAGTFTMEYNPTTDKFDLWEGTTSTLATATTTVAPNTWALIDIRINVAANPWVTNWSINGVAQPDHSPALAATTFSSVVFGNPFAGFTGTMRWDDILASVTSGDYPLGAHHVEPLKVDPAGTITVSGATTNFNTFVSNGTLTAWNATTARNNIDEIPPVMGASADGLAQVVIASTSYVEIPMTTYTLVGSESVLGCALVANGWAASTTAATIGFRSWNGTTERTLFAAGDPGFDSTATTNAWMSQMLTLADVDTQAEIDALAFRVGFSTDVTPNIGINAIMAELAVTVSTAVVAATVPININQAVRRSSLY